MLFLMKIPCVQDISLSSGQTGIKVACISSADPEGGTGGPDPTWKITSYMGFYRE